MNLHKTLGTTISMLFLLGLTVIVAGIFYFANGATEIISASQFDWESETL